MFVLHYSAIEEIFVKTMFANWNRHLKIVMQGSDGY